MSVLVSCSNCGSQARMNIGQTIVGDQLRWFTSTTCEECSCAEEADGIGPLPDDLREIIIKQQGVWRLCVSQMGANPAVALKALRSVLGLSVSEVARLKRQLPTYIGSGTRIEMEYLKQRLLAACATIELELVAGETG